MILNLANRLKVELQPIEMSIGLLGHCHLDGQSKVFGDQRMMVQTLMLWTDLTMFTQMVTI